ncbi:S8 family serine peptidase [Tenacibaculum agarivorans]|uniref:S8 family serine peptidase n=1 Tax=Tenacibaculum agarivorans TaxID=1908389 RepID=UPI00094BB477|nr:S8 family serine peptidase [Tenacibaculum agarivorans]
MFTSQISINHIYIIVLILLSSCNNSKYISIEDQNIPLSQVVKEEKVKDWSHKDILLDSIPGISLERAYNTILKNKSGKEVIVALIDTGVDINHKNLKDHIWINDDEILDNNLDDDKNGHIDDIQGWNFSGNDKEETNKYNHYDYTRIVSAFRDKYKNKDEDDINSSDLNEFKMYKRAEKRLKEKTKSVAQEKEYAQNVFIWKNKAIEILKNKTKIENITIQKLDSIKKLYAKDSIIQLNIKIATGFIKNGYTDDYIDGLKLRASNMLSKQLNVNYNERKVTGDDPNDMANTNYGNSEINADINFFTHGTIVAGVIAKNTPEIKVMPLCISGFGTKHDKDIAQAIYYAVNNGAKVINMSFGKDFSLHKEWIDDAIKYAEKHNVLIVTSAGNDNDDMDNIEKFNYPDDRDENGKEIVSNFLKVGGSTYNINEDLKYGYSNYGLKNVDLFAPAEKIYTTFPDNKFKYDTGTSLASAITAKIGALLYSYYPKLTSSEVKNILMDSGIKYNFNVKVSSKENKTIPFDKLSKSGRVLNAYNAFIMADSIISH